MFNSIISSLRRVSVVALAAFILSAISPAAWAEGEDYNFPGLASTVTVYEDILGIPSIVGETEHDVVFVLGYIHARDRFFQMDLNRKAVAGRLAELLGPAALASDIELRTFGLGRAAIATWQVLSPETKGVMQSYANGINTYLRNNPLPPEYVALELTTTDPWTPLDTVLIGKGLVAQFALGTADIDRTIALQAYQTVGQIAGFDGAALFFEDVYRSAPADDRVTVPGFLASIGGIGQSNLESASSAQKSALQAIDYSSFQIPESTIELAKQYKASAEAGEEARNHILSLTEISGSNVWVIGGQHTASGYPILANDPHISLDTPATFHEAQLIYKKDGEPWHVSGIVAPGTPGVLLGCSSFACWGYTVNPLDTGDFFADQTVAGGAFPFPTHTVHDGMPEPIQYVYQSYFANGIGDGVPDTIGRVGVPLDTGGISFVVPRRYNGSIIGFLPTGEALTVQNTALGPVQTIDMILKMNQAGSMQEFKDSLQYFDTGIQNVMYADVDGNIAYFTVNEHPIREDLAAGTVEGLPPWFIRDGTGALNNEWLPVQNPQPQQILPFEILPFNEMPQVINPPSGFINNANNDPIGTSLDNNPLNQLRPGGTNGIYYLSPGYAAGYRMGRIDRAVKEMVDSGVPITMEMVAELQGNAQPLDAELILPMLMPAFDGLQLPPQHPMAQALDVFSTWDFSTPTGLAEGYDAGDDPFMMVEPGMTEIRNSAAASIWAAWRTRLLANTIDALFEQLQLSDYRPDGSTAWKAFKHHLENYPTRGGIGASGLPFFPGGFTETIQGSLAQALEMLASDEFAPAFGNSQNVLDYRWGKLHRIVFDHPLGGPFNVPYSGDIPNAGGFMNLAPDLPGIARQGGYEVVDDSDSNVRASTLNGFMFGGGPNRRFVGTTGPDRITAWEVIPGGQSGIFLHPNYASQLPLWLTNNYHPMALGEDDAIASAFMTYTMGPPVSQLESLSDTFTGVSPLRPQFQPRGGLRPGDNHRAEGGTGGHPQKR